MTLDVDGRPLDAPVQSVTLLEDRAVVRREGRIALDAGRHRLAIAGVSAVLQDVSLQAELTAGSGRVADVRARRAWRILSEDRPEEAARLEAEIDANEREFDRLTVRRKEAARRVETTTDMIGLAVTEIPVDAAWGRGHVESWESGLTTLFSRAQAAAVEQLEGRHAQEDLRDTLENLFAQRKAVGRLDTELAGWVIVDVQTETAGEVAVAVEYVVPCALWRPMHRARWTGSTEVAVHTAAVVWQNTGEDWRDVELRFSTSRASLGHEPPTLTDDPLEAERKDDEVIIEAREVEVEAASVEEAEGAVPGGVEPPPSPSGVELPGVDDGGRTRHLVAPGRHEVRSDGRPVRIPLASSTAEGQGELVTMPELSTAAVWRVVARHGGDAPLLAGPVELVRTHGPVGWTQTRFVAPGATFELGYGPDDSVRVERTIGTKNLKRRDDEWPATRRTVRVFLSNLGDEPRRVKVVERLPVSEVDEVRITLEGDATSPGHAVDDDGFLTWHVDLAGYAQSELKLAWVAEVAPSVDWAP